MGDPSPCNLEVERLLGHSLPFHQEGEFKGKQPKEDLVLLTGQCLQIVHVPFNAANLCIPEIMSVARAKGNINLCCFLPRSAVCVW